MIVNYINTDGWVKKACTGKQLIASAKKYLKVHGKKDNINEYDLICSIFKYKKKCGLSDEVLTMFIKGFLPKRYCVYKLYYKEEIIYIGSSYALETRLVSHRQDKVFDKVEVCTAENKESMLNLENYLIDQYKPPINKTLNLKRVGQYKIRKEGELFRPLIEYIWDLPVRNGKIGSLYHQIGGNVYNYSFDALNTGGRYATPSFFIQTNNVLRESKN